MSGPCSSVLEMPTAREIDPESTGFVGPDEEAVTGRETAARPLSMAWISDELLAETIEVWSEAYGRQIGEEEAVEILMNVKRLGEIMVNAIREMNGK